MLVLTHHTVPWEGMRQWWEITFFWVVGTIENVYFRFQSPSCDSLATLSKLVVSISQHTSQASEGLQGWAWQRTIAGQAHPYALGLLGGPDLCDPGKLVTVMRK